MRPRTSPPVAAAAAPSCSITWYRIVDGRLQPAAGGETDRVAVLMHDQFRATILSAAFPCLGGAGAVRRGDYAFAAYDALGSSSAISASATHLREFLAGRPAERHPVSVFVTAFTGPAALTETRFEELLWAHLMGLRRLDTADFADCSVCIDACDPGFIFEGREFFVVGLHPAATRWSRRFAWPVLVFNSLTHAVPLRQSGKHERMRQRILARDRRLQGSDNPSLGASQLAQFSGRQVGPDWLPPGAGGG
jgi:uncharacterized protein